jgi:hypothetical protein
MTFVIDNEFRFHLVHHAFVPSIPAHLSLEITRGNDGTGFSRISRPRSEMRSSIKLRPRGFGELPETPKTTIKDERHLNLCSCQQTGCHPKQSAKKVFWIYRQEDDSAFSSSRHHIKRAFQVFYILIPEQTSSLSTCSVHSELPRRRAARCRI